jgi:Leucine-rich repeat (LRR) protein
VVFGDKALESAIRAELRLPFGLLTQADLLQLRVLDARNLNISSLSGLEYCTNLTWLNLDTNGLSDITPLTRLSNLTYLNLEANDVTNIWPLSGLVFLKDLLLSGNEVWDLAALVANAEVGGIGYGSVVTLDKKSLVTSDDELPVDVAEDVNRLLQLGVTVIFTTETAK